MPHGTLVPEHSRQQSFKKGSMKGTVPGCVNPTPVWEWDPSLGVGPQPAQPPGMGLHPKSGRQIREQALCSFSLISCRCYFAEQLICNVVIVVSVQPPDSVLRIYGVSLLCFFGPLPQKFERSAEYQVLVEYLSQMIIFVTYFLEIQSSLYRLEIQISVYMWKEGKKRIVLVGYLLQIQISRPCRILPPNSFQTLQFFLFLEPFV